jgi:hypothetical protein
MRESQRVSQPARRARERQAERERIAAVVATLESFTDQLRRRQASLRP